MPWPAAVQAAASRLFILRPIDVARTLPAAGDSVATTDGDAHTDGGHTDRVELFITDKPVPAPAACNPDVAIPGVCTVPEFGVDFLLPNTCTTYSGARGVSLEHVNAYVEWQLIDPGGALNPVGDPCIPAQPHNRNHFEIDIDGTASNLSLYVSDPGGASFPLYYQGNVGNLGFTRGHIAINHVSYNAPKEGFPASSAYNWANVGFDGPVLPVDRAWDLPDALSTAYSGGATSLNLGYQVEPGGVYELCCDPALNFCRSTPIAPFSSPSLDISGLTKGFITLDAVVESGATPAPLRSFTIGSSAGWNPTNGSTSWVALAIPITLSDLQQQRLPGRS